MHSTSLYQAYEPCYKELTEIGGLSFQYNQMYSLSKALGSYIAYEF